MNNKKNKFLEEYSENFSELFIEMFILRYGPIENYDRFIEDFKLCQILTRKKIVKKLTSKIAKKISTK